MVTIQELLLPQLRELGFYDVLLPWLLFFAIFYGLLWRTKLFEGVKKPLENKLYVIVAVVLSFFVINFVPPVLSLGDVLTGLFGQASIVLAGFLVLILFMGMLKGMGVLKEGTPIKAKWTGLAMAALIILAIVIFVASGAATALGVVLGIPSVSPAALFSTDVLITILMVLLIVGVVVAFAIGGPRGEKEEAEKKE